MNHKLISKAISGIDGKYIAQSLTPPVTGVRAPERMETMGKYQQKRGTSLRRIVGLALAACFVIAFAASAYATNAFGLRELFQTENQEIPEPAVPYIRQHTEATSQDGLTARVMESLCDSGKLMATVEVSGGEKFILCEQSFNQDDPVDFIGISGGQTLQEYADSQGKTLLFVGAMLDGESFTGVQSTRYEYDGLGNLTVLISADLVGNIAEAVCNVTAVNMADANGNIQRLSIPFTVSPAVRSQERVFFPDEPNAIPGLTLGNATVTESPLGMTIRWPEIMADECNVMEVEIVGCNYGEGGTIAAEDGTWYFNASMVEGTIGDSFTVAFYDWEHIFMGEVHFCLK